MQQNLIIKDNVSHRRKGSMLYRMLKQWDIQIMVIPAIILILIFSYIPMWGLLMSFQEYNMFRGFFDSKWVGLKHFNQLFTDPRFPLVMRNTIGISSLKLLIGFPAPIIFALLFNEVRHDKFKRVMQTISYLPHFLSMVVVAGLAISMLSIDNGSINILLQKLHLIKEPIAWFNEPKYFWGIIVSTGVWKDVGFGSIVYLAAIAGIDVCLYEAASIDGASRIQQLFKVTLPCIFPVIAVFLILAVSHILNAGFENILLLAQNPALYDVSDVLDIYVYKIGIQSQRFSYATAAGLFKSVVSVTLLVTANRISKKLTESSLW